MNEKTRARAKGRSKEDILLIFFLLHHADRNVWTGGRPLAEAGGKRPFLRIIRHRCKKKSSAHSERCRRRDVVTDSKEGKRGWHLKWWGLGGRKALIKAHLRWQESWGEGGRGSLIYDWNLGCDAYFGCIYDMQRSCSETKQQKWLLFVYFTNKFWIMWLTYFTGFDINWMQAPFQGERREQADDCLHFRFVSAVFFAVFFFQN